MASPLADFVVSLGTDGRIATQGTVSDALAKNKKLAEEVEIEEKAIELDEVVDEVEGDQEAPVAGKGKLVLAEEIEEGHVSKDACESSHIPLREHDKRDTNWLCSQVVPRCPGWQVAVPLLEPVYSRIWSLGGLRQLGDVVARILGTSVHFARSQGCFSGIVSSLFLCLIVTVSQCVS